MWFQNARAKFRRNLSKQQQQQQHQQVLAYVNDPLNSPPPPPGCHLQAPWDHRHAAVTSPLADADDDDRALRHVTNPDFRYARRDVIGAYEQPATHCRDCCSLEMGLAAENASHAHHYQQLYQ